MPFRATEGSAASIKFEVGKQVQMMGCMPKMHMVQVWHCRYHQRDVHDLLYSHQRVRQRKPWRVWHASQGCQDAVCSCAQNLVSERGRIGQGAQQQRALDMYNSAVHCASESLLTPRQLMSALVQQASVRDMLVR